MKKNYQTTQKQLVECYLAEHTSQHFTVEELTQLLNSKEKTISATTVYRHLEALSNSGIANKYKLNNFTRYQFVADKGDCSKHFHFRCSRCGDFSHFDCHELGNVSSHLFEKHGLKLNMAQTVFNGSCQKCDKSP